MIRNYLKAAFRALLKNRAYTALNIAGLAVGVAACMLILLYVSHETSYDTWNPQSGRIVRPTYHIKITGFEEYHGAVDATVGPQAAEAFPEIQSWCRIRQFNTWKARREDQTLASSRDERVLSVDSTFFDIFPLKIIAGSARNALNQPGTAAIARSRAAYYFASPEMAIGQTLVMGDNERHQITAVYEDMPENSHFQVDILFPLTGNQEVRNAPPYWGYNNNFYTYLLLRPGTDEAVFSKKFEALAFEKVSVLIKDLFGTTTSEFEKSGQAAQFGIQKLTDIHLHSAFNTELGSNGNIQYVWIFSAIAFFILLIACINFMNLSTARSSGRAREIGVRKVLGSTRSALAGQFLTESVVLAAIAICIAPVLVYAALPGFNELSERNLSIPGSNPVFWVSLVAGGVLTGLLAGLYPAFFLSAFQTIKVLKGPAALNGSTKGLRLRNGLVVFQFAISTVLIICTILVYFQLQYIQQKQLGFDKSQVLIIENTGIPTSALHTFESNMQQQAGVEKVSISNYLPLPNRNRGNCILSEKRGTSESDKVFQRWFTDAAYIRTLGMEIIQGRDFDPARVTDSTAIIVNETAARELGFADPLGQTLYTSRSKAVDSKAADFMALTIIGVVKDFHFESLYNQVGGLFFQLAGERNGSILLRTNGSSTAKVIARVEQEWAALGTDRPLEYHFMDETLDKAYRSERRIGTIALIFALMSVFVSCLGLFGLAAYMTERRTKEIGVRKVLGASVAGITGLLAKDFLKSVLIAVIIASPIASYLMQRWLSDFAWHIEIRWWIFVLAGGIAVVIAAMTVSFQSIRAALADPVQSLKSE